MHPTVAVIPCKEPRPERFDLGDGLVMRWSTTEDKDNIADCLADAFRVKSLSYSVFAELITLELMPLHSMGHIVVNHGTTGCRRRSAWQERDMLARVVSVFHGFSKIKSL